MGSLNIHTSIYACIAPLDAASKLSGARRRATTTNRPVSDGIELIDLLPPLPTFAVWRETARRKADVPTEGDRWCAQLGPRKFGAVDENVERLAAT